MRAEEGIPECFGPKPEVPALYSATRPSDGYPQARPAEGLCGRYTTGFGTMGTGPNHR
jgi:hypothetical protein